MKFNLLGFTEKLWRENLREHYLALYRSLFENEFADEDIRIEVEEMKKILPKFFNHYPHHRDHCDYNHESKARLAESIHLFYRTELVSTVLSNKGFGNLDITLFSTQLPCIKEMFESKDFMQTLYMHIVQMVEDRHLSVEAFLYLEYEQRKCTAAIIWNRIVFCQVAAKQQNQA